MAKIHGLVYIIIGILISIASWKINKEELYLFFYVGILFIGVGAAKLLLGLLKSRKEDEKVVHHKAPHHQSRHLQHYKHCSRCRNVMRINDRFCSRCGFGI